jgi:hypothetical protein
VLDTPFDYTGGAILVKMCNERGVYGTSGHETYLYGTINQNLLIGNTTGNAVQTAVQCHNHTITTAGSVMSVGNVRPNFRIDIDMFSHDTVPNEITSIGVSHPRLKKEAPGTNNVPIFRVEIST